MFILRVIVITNDGQRASFMYRYIDLVDLFKSPPFLSKPEHSIVKEHVTGFEIFEVLRAPCFRSFYV